MKIDTFTVLLLNTFLFTSIAFIKNRIFVPSGREMYKKKNAITENERVFHCCRSSK